MSAIAYIDRAGLVSDARDLMAAGYTQTSSFLELAGNLKTETNFFVWSEILEAVTQLSAAWLFEEPAVKAGIQVFTRDLLASTAQTIGFQLPEADSQTGQQLKELILLKFTLSGDETAIQAALELFQKNVAGDETVVHPTLRNVVYATAARQGGEIEVSFDKMSKT